MKTYEFIQKAGNGGFPVPNGEGFRHGDGVYVVSTRELFSLLYRTLAMITCEDDEDEATRNELIDLLMHDTFVDREGLGELSKQDILDARIRLGSKPKLP